MTARKPESRERLRFPGVPAPKALLSPETERRLTVRQRQLLDELEELVVAKGVADLTMAEIAARVNCSLRTLYGIAPSREELVLTIVDRRLHRIGRAAIGSLDASLSPLAALRAYLRAVNEAVQPETDSFSREFADLPGACRLLDSHEGYVIAVTRACSTARWRKARSRRWTAPPWPTSSADWAASSRAPRWPRSPQRRPRRPPTPSRRSSFRGSSAAEPTRGVQAGVRSACSARSMSSIASIAAR
jgi:AcrR family transcriptional regulator